MERSEDHGKSAGPLVVGCDCGFEARGSDDELIPIGQRHGGEAPTMRPTKPSVGGRGGGI